MRLPHFDLAQPASLAEAVRLLADGGPDARAVAGGTDLIGALRFGTRAPRLVVSLERVAGHRHITFDPGQGLCLGALATLAEVAAAPVVQHHYPALARAAGAVASPQVRHRATLGGNLCLDKRCWFYNQSETWREAHGQCLRAGGEQCYVVKGSPCHALVTADTAPALLALDAELVVLGPAGARRLPMAEFFAGVGDDTHRLGPAELLAEVRLPPPTPGARGVYLRHAARGAIDYPLAQVAVVLQLEDGVCRQARIVVGALAPNPLRAEQAEALLIGQGLTAELAGQAAEVAVRAVRVVPYIGRTPDYKRRVTRGYLVEAIRQAGGLPAEERVAA